MNHNHVRYHELQQLLAPWGMTPEQFYRGLVEVGNAIQAIIQILTLIAQQLERKNPGILARLAESPRIQPDVVIED
jgi:hypothetical protein